MDKIAELTARIESLERQMTELSNILPHEKTMNMGHMHGVRVNLPTGGIAFGQTDYAYGVSKETPDQE